MIGTRWPCPYRPWCASAADPFGEFRISPAETYDVIVHPQENAAQSAAANEKYAWRRETFNKPISQKERHYERTV
jgi:hypothetical protein